MSDEAPAPVTPDPTPPPVLAPAAAPEAPLDGQGKVARIVAECRARGRHPEVAAVLAFLLPGLGHVYLGKQFKGFVAFVFLVGLYAAGLFITRGECVSLDKEWGHPYAFFAQVGCGLPTGLALLRTHVESVKKVVGGDDTVHQYPKPWDSQDDAEKEAFTKRLPALDEGLLYTMIAGLLNLLLIHDALLGAPGGILRREPKEALA
ncbi:MAG TPA: DUF6677 family protein [Planctomycetota bacterium]|nr:DUF6677 family protein [Planctomycetota bacterium]